jgi:HSP20 family protein
MALVRVRPQAWDLINRNFFQDVDRFLNDASLTNGNTYGVDLYETDEQVVLEMTVPGLKAEDLDVSAEGRQLTIRGKYPTTETENRRYWVQGIVRGDFNRTVTLPANVQLDNVQAKFQDGILSLTMPKVAEAKVKKIAITN